MTRLILRHLLFAAFFALGLALLWGLMFATHVTMQIVVVTVIIAILAAAVFLIGLLSWSLATGLTYKRRPE